MDLISLRHRSVVRFLEIKELIQLKISVDDPAFGRNEDFMNDSIPDNYTSLDSVQTRRKLSCKVS